MLSVSLTHIMAVVVVTNWTVVVVVVLFSLQQLSHAKVILVKCNRQRGNVRKHF